MEKLLVAILALGLCVLPGHIFSAAGSGGGEGGLIFLDLPDGFGLSEEDEDEPELIDFYAEQYEGDAFFFCLDKSDSMNEASASGQPKWVVRNREAINAISAMSSRSVASIVFFDWKKMQSDTCGDPPIKMDAAGKARMVAFITKTTVANHEGSDSCIGEGMLKTLQITNKTKHEYRVIILTADGRLQCDGGDTNPERVFGKIMSANVFRIPINTIYTGLASGTDWTEGKPLLERLARATNGKFKIAR